MWYNTQVAEGKAKTSEVEKKTSKKFRKPLDKPNLM